MAKPDVMRMLELTTIVKQTTGIRHEEDVFEKLFPDERPDESSVQDDWIATRIREQRERLSPEEQDQRFEQSLQILLTYPLGTIHMVFIRFYPNLVDRNPYGFI